MSRATERLRELKDKGLITEEQYSELLAALERVAPDLSEALAPLKEPGAPQPPSQPEPVVPAASAPVGDLPPAAPVFAVQPASGSLTVRLISEDLHVRGVQGLAGVRVVRGQSSIRTHQHGDSVDIESGFSTGDFHGFSFTLGFGGDGEPVELEVPAGMPCEFKTVSGDMIITDITGETTARSVSGDLKLGRMTHLRSAQSTSGDVEVDQCLVDGDVISKSGDVEVQSSTVRGMLKSYSGDVTIRDTVLNDTDVLSFSGDVELEAVTVQAGARLRTTSGDVSADLNQHDVLVDVETRSGEATVRGPGVDIETSHQRIPVGLATVEISAHTGSGDIDIRLK